MHSCFDSIEATCKSIPGHPVSNDWCLRVHKCNSHVQVRINGISLVFMTISLVFQHIYSRIYCPFVINTPIIMKT